MFFISRSGAQSLTLSKIVPHICNLLGDPNSQVSFWSESPLEVVLVALLVSRAVFWLRIELIVLLVVTSDQWCS